MWGNLFFFFFCLSHWAVRAERLKGIKSFHNINFSKSKDAGTPHPRAGHWSAGLGQCEPCFWTGLPPWVQERAFLGLSRARGGEILVQLQLLPPES